MELDWDVSTCTCSVCGKKYHFGHHMYEYGTYIERYKMPICNDCDNKNVDGWCVELESKLLEHLLKEAIAEPERNKNGLYPRR